MPVSFEFIASVVSLAVSVIALVITVFQWVNVGPKQILSWINQIPALVSMIAAAVALCIPIVLLARSSTDLGSLYLVIASSAVAFATTIVISLKALDENRRLREAQQYLHRFSHHLRDEIKRLTHASDPISREVEKLLLQQFCNEIAELFTLVTKGKSHACVYLVAADSDRVPRKCFLYAHDKDVDERSLCWEQMDISCNDCFRIAKNHHGVTGTAFFYSANLVKEKEYAEQPRRPMIYPNLIVVPLRAKTAPGEQDVDKKFELIGFLQVKTRIANHLNPGYHVELLACLADQVFVLLDLGRLPRNGNGGTRRP
jgi:hypothetical protein